MGPGGKAIGRSVVARLLLEIKMLDEANKELSIPQFILKVKCATKCYDAINAGKVEI
jgi:hypothetical protein